MHRIIWIVLVLIGLTTHAQLKVVTSFTILKDLVEQVGGEEVTVTSIVPPNSDPHTYEPHPKDVILLSKADLVMINGLHFETWFERLLKASQYKGTLVVASKTIKARTTKSGSVDPHAWHSIPNAIAYVQVITKALQEKLPSKKEYFAERAERYIKTLEVLHQKIHVEVDKIHPERRVVSAHDAFEYFGETYGIKFYAPMGTSTEAEPTPRELLRLIKFIKDHKIKMIFLENISSPRLIEQIARETGAKIGGMLYSDSLSESDAPGATYVGMVTHNVRLFLQAMGAKPSF